MRAHAYAYVCAGPFTACWQLLCGYEDGSLVLWDLSSSGRLVADVGGVHVEPLLCLACLRDVHSCAHRTPGGCSQPGALLPPAVGSIFGECPSGIRARRTLQRTQHAWCLRCLLWALVKTA